MRILTMLLFTAIFGAAGFGAWIMMSSDAPSLLPGTETKQADNPAAQASRAKQAKWRDAPYVILAPAQTLPEKQSAAPPPPPPPPPSPPPEPAKPKLAAPRVAPPQATPPPAEKSSIAKLALETVIGQQATQQTTAETAPQPKAPPAAEERPQTEPQNAAPKQVAQQQVAQQQVARTSAPPLTQPATPAAPAPAAQQTATEKKKLQLLYEAKADSRSETILKQQSLLAKEQIRFRRPVPLSSGILKSEKMTIALVGIDGLVADAQCKYASGKSWECGRWGKYALRRLIRGRSITCDVIEQVTENIVSARCKVAGVDINNWVVRRGWGRPSSEGTDKYDVALKAAKDDKLGQWSIEEIVKKN